MASAGKDAVIERPPTSQRVVEAALVDSLGLPNARAKTTNSSKHLPFPTYCLSKFEELTNVKFALASFVINNLRRRYQRSILGFAWSLLNPLLMMCVLTAVFSLIFGKDPRTYGIFLFTGMLPFTFLNDSLSAGSVSITGAESFMKKVYIPKTFFPLVTCLTEGVNFMLSLCSMIILALCLGLTVHPAICLLPFAILPTVLFVFGATLTVAVLTVYFRDLTHILRVLLQCLFYLTPILYTLDQVPAKFAPFFRLNPCTTFITIFRDVIVLGVVPTAQQWLLAYGLAIAALVVGFFVLMKKEKDIIFRL